MELLGSAILGQALKKTIANKLHTCHLMTHRLQQLDTHMSFFLLKNAVSLHRLLILLRSSHCYRHSDDLAPYDKCTRNSTVDLQRPIRQYRLGASKPTFPSWRPRTPVCQWSGPSSLPALTWVLSTLDIDYFPNNIWAFGRKRRRCHYDLDVIWLINSRYTCQTNELGLPALLCSSVCLETQP